MIQNQEVTRKLALAMSIIALAGVWLVLLPAYANSPAMKQHLEWLDKKGVDPSAMYYTELEVMDDILARQRSRALNCRDAAMRDTFSTAEVSDRDELPSIRD